MSNTSTAKKAAASKSSHIPMSEKKSQASAKIRSMCRRACDLRDERDAALKVAAAALATLEITVASETVAQADIDATERVYEDEVAALIGLNTTLEAACDDFVREGASLLLGRSLPDELAKAVLRENATLLYRSRPDQMAKA
jgi:hypothetical protein